MVKRILIVDDDAGYLELLSALLSERYDLLAASNVGDALGALEAGRPDLVLLDLGMPGLSGLDFIAAVSELPIPRRRTPIVVMTATSPGRLSPEIMRRLDQAANVQEVVEKPYDPSILTGRIDEAFSLQVAP